MQNNYPLWKNLLLISLVIIGVIYSLPSLFGEDPAVQISPKSTYMIDNKLIASIKEVLQHDQLPFLNVARDRDTLLVRFKNPDVQLKAQDRIKSLLGDHYTAALNLAPRTPNWLRAIGGEALKLGLDLRGGVYFLLDVDIDALIKSHEEGDMHTAGDTLRKAKIHYAGMSRTKPNGIIIKFRDQKTLDEAYDELGSALSDYQLLKMANDGQFQIKALLKQNAFTKIANAAIDQAMFVLNKRVNNLGVSEAVVQRQGIDHISVELPGIQDTARAKSIVGKVASLRYQLVDDEHDLQSAVAGDVPIGSKLYMDENGQPILLYDQVILQGDSITYATATLDEHGRPAVAVRLGSGDIAAFNRITGENVGKRMGVVYVEPRVTQQKINGKVVTVHKTSETVISAAVIESALGNNFQTTGLPSMKDAQDLALLLRSGALLAPINIVSENTIGPSLGADNIHKGLVSIIIGFLAAVLFMIFYYHLFGIVADIALVLNLLFIVSIFSMLGVTLTLPGIAAMVLTVGMAVDANVLIYERIREELRNGISPQASIQIGYDRAFITIVDSNVTTLIVALVLYAVGTGSVKGFAVTLIVGLLASMLTSVVYTRGIVNWIYSGKVKKLSIGI